MLCLSVVWSPTSLDTSYQGLGPFGLTGFGFCVAWSRVGPNGHEKIRYNQYQ